MTKFKHWREAEARASELKTELETLLEALEKDTAEARREDMAVETRDALITTIEAAVARQAELQGEYDEAVAETETLKTEETRQFGLLANVEKRKVDERMTNREEKNVLETRAYELAWVNYIRTNDATEVRELISTQNDESAGVMVPTTLVNKIEDTFRTGGRILALASITSIKGITEHPVAKSRTNPAWHDETGATEKPEKKIALTSVSIDPQFIAETLRVTRKFENDSVSAFWDWLNAELPDALLRVVDKELLYGAQSGVSGIRGVLTNESSLFVATMGTHTLNFNTANTAVSYLDDGAANNVVAVMNKKTFLQNVMGLVGTDGHPIYQQVATTNLNRPSFFFGGYPVVFTDDMPAYDEATAGLAYMLFGDFTALRVNFPNGFAPNLIRDELTQKKKNIIEYLSEIYVGGNIVRPGSFVKVTK